MRICSGVGCLRTVPNDARYCTECSTDRQAPAVTGWQRAQDDPILLQYTTRRWRRLTPRVLNLYPLCVQCRRALSQVADHHVPARLIVSVCRAERLFIDPWGGFYIAANLRGMCHSCHNRKSKQEDAQDWHDEIARLLAPYRMITKHLEGVGRG